MLPADELPFATVTPPSFQMEIESLESAGASVLLDQAPFVTELFELDRRWPEEGNHARQGPQGSIFEEEDDEEEEVEEEDNSWRTAGVSTFTLIDAGGESIMRQESGGKVAYSRTPSKEALEEVQDVGSTNGLIPQLGFTADGKEIGFAEVWAFFNFTGASSAQLEPIAQQAAVVQLQQHGDPKSSHRRPISQAEQPQVFETH